MKAKDTRTPRPFRIVTLADGEQFVQEYGRRAGLHTSKSQTAYHRTASNRLDRRDARRQLRRDPDSVSNRARKTDSVWLAT